MILEIDNVELSFDNRKILKAIYLKAELGQVTGILGRNGSGKTSLLKILFGHLSPKYKNIRINGKHQKKALYKSSLAAYLPQHSLLPNSFTLKKAFKLFNTNWDDFTAHFPSFKIYKNAKISALSSGEVRIVETYLILYSGKKIILLDEPFSYIAPLYVEKFVEIMNHIKKEQILIVTDHLYKEILELTNNIYFLKNGNSKLINSKAELEQEGYI